MQNLLSAVLFRFTRGTHFGEPTFECFRYANLMITEAFYARTNRTRLAHFIAALEALTIIPLNHSGKSEEIARRCSLATSQHSLINRGSIYDAVYSAYKARNDVVHGAAFSEHNAFKALTDLEPFLIDIVFSLIEILIWIRIEKKPQSMKPLKKEMTKLMNQIEDQVK